MKGIEGTWRPQKPVAVAAHHLGDHLGAVGGERGRAEPEDLLGGQGGRHTRAGLDLYAVIRALHLPGMRGQGFGDFTHPFVVERCHHRGHGEVSPYRPHPPRHRIARRGEHVPYCATGHLVSVMHIMRSGANDQIGRVRATECCGDVVAGGRLRCKQVVPR